MTRKCVVPHCGHIASSEKGSNGCKYLCFPKDPERRRKWIQAAGVEDLVLLPANVLNKNRFICSCHFEPRPLTKFIKKSERVKKFPTIFDPRVKPLSDIMMLEFGNQKIQKIETTPVRVPLIGPLSDDLNESLSAVTVDKLVKTRKLSSVRLSTPKIVDTEKKVVQPPTKTPRVSVKKPRLVKNTTKDRVPVHDDHQYLRRLLTQAPKELKITSAETSKLPKSSVDNQTFTPSKTPIQVSLVPEVEISTNTTENFVQTVADSAEPQLSDTSEEFATFGRVVSMKLGLMTPFNAQTAKSEINKILNSLLAR